MVSASVAVTLAIAAFRLATSAPQAGSRLAMAAAASGLTVSYFSFGAPPSVEVSAQTADARTSMTIDPHVAKLVKTTSEKALAAAQASQSC